MAFGFKPVRYRDGSAYSGASQRCSHSTAEDIYVGDTVALTGTGDALGIPGVALAGETAGLYGVVVSIDPVVTNLANSYKLSGTTGYVNVATDKNVIYQCTEDGTGGFLAATSIGLNTNGTAGTPSTAFGTSGQVLDSSDLNTTSTLQWRLVGLAQIEGNAFGTTDTVWEVTINESDAQSVGVTGA